MTVHYFDYRDAGAPVLSGQAGKATDLLDACLVNGYNSQTVTTVTRSGSVVTVTKTAHGFRDGARLNISGANESEYNGDFYITVTGANTFTYTLASGTPATPATGTVTAKVAAAGWGIAFTGTNKRAYRAPSGLRHYLRIEDNNGHAQGHGYAGMRGYVAMTDIDTGTEPFPTVAQKADNVTLLWKSGSADSTARPWVLVATQTAFHLICFANTTTTVGIAGNTNYQPGNFFGEIVSNKAGDAYSTMLICNFNTTNNNYYGTVNSVVNSTLDGHWLARSYTQSGTSQAAAKFGGYDRMASGIMGSHSGNGAMFPDPVTGGLNVCPIQVSEYAGSAYTAVVRGLLPGLWNPLHQFPLTPGDTIDGAGATAGKKFLMVDVGNSNNRARAALEISNTW